MTHIEEKSRRLHITVGDDHGREGLVIEPTGAEAGECVAAGIIAGAVGANPDEDAAAKERSALAALGSENAERVQKLRHSEMQQALMCAVLWSATGGGLDAVQTYLAGDALAALRQIATALGLAHIARALRLDTT